MNPVREQFVAAESDGRLTVPVTVSGAHNFGFHRATHVPVDNRVGRIARYVLRILCPPTLHRSSREHRAAFTRIFYTSLMRSRFRTALMWLLLLALPLQGFAAATMINCGPNHHRMAEAVMAEMPATHEHASAGQHHHSMEATGDRHDAVSSGSDAPSVHHLDKLMKFKCSACAACCMGAAMPTAAVTFKAFPPAIAPDSIVPTAHVGFVTDGPDRPPRISLV